MRILLVNNFGRVTGGADRHVLELAALLTDAGHEVRLFATADPENEWAAGSFVPLTVSNATRDAIRGVQALEVAAKSMWYPQAYRAMRRELEAWRPDVIHLHKLYAQLSVAPAVASWRSGAAVVQTAHDYEFFSADVFAADGGALSRAEASARYRAVLTGHYLARRLLHRRAVDEWVCVSRHAARRYAEHGIHATALPNFTLAPPLAAPPARAQRRGLFLGARLTPEKGVAEAIALASEAGHEVRIAGDGELRSAVEAAAATTPSLTYLGKLGPQQMRAELERAAAVLMPSGWEEPGPLACLEAMAAGTPVVCYATAGGLAEYVGDAGAGPTPQPGPGALRAAVDALLADDAAWASASAAGLAAVATGAHDPAAYVPKLLAVYERALAR